MTYIVFTTLLLTTIFCALAQFDVVMSTTNVSKNCTHSSDSGDLIIADCQKFNMVCDFYGKCSCSAAYPIEYPNVDGHDWCLPVVKLGYKCIFHKQCESYDDYSVCDSLVKRCKCQSTHEIVSLNSYSKCMKKYETKSKDIYKAAMVALACFMVTVIGLFILFLCNRSFLRRNRRSRADNSNSRRTSDVFNISENLAAMRLCDKPPTYDDVVRTDRMIRGVPPPEYTEMNNNASTRNTEPASNAGPSTGSSFFFFFRRQNPGFTTTPVVVQGANQQPTLQLQNLSETAPSGTGQINPAFVSDV